LRFISSTHATSYNFFSALLCTVKEKGGIPDKIPYPLPYGFRNPYRNLKFGELSKKLYVHEFGIRKGLDKILQHIRTDRPDLQSVAVTHISWMLFLR
jgi:hypothetical protein